MRTDDVVEFAEKSSFHMPWTRVGGHDAEGRVRRPKSAGEKLRAEKIRVVADSEDLRFLMDVLLRSHTVTTGHKTQGCILNRLQPADNEARLDNRAPNASSVGI